MRHGWTQCLTVFSIGDNVIFGCWIAGKLSPMKKKMHGCFQFLQATHTNISLWNFYSHAFHCCNDLQSTSWSLCDWWLHISWLSVDDEIILDHQSLMGIEGQTKTCMSVTNFQGLQYFFCIKILTKHRLWVWKFHMDGQS